MRVELGQFGQKDYRYRLRIGEKNLPMIALTRRPAGVENKPKTTPPSLPEFVELGTLGTENRLYRLRWTDGRGKLIKPYLTRRPATEQEVAAIERKWRRLKRAASGVVKDAVKEAITPDWTKGLIAFNTAAFLASQLNPDLVGTIADSSSFLHLNSYLFHTDWQHLVGNMIPLYIFGREAEKRAGGKTMLLTYLLSGMAGGGANIIDNAINPLQIKDYGVTLPREIVGASGAVMGLMGLSAVNAFREKSFGKFALLGTAATMLTTGIGMGPAIDKLGHTVGFITGTLSGLLQKPTPNQLQETRITQMRTAPLAA